MEPPGTPPLAAPVPLVDLPVPGFAAAVVSLPRHAQGLRPVLVAAHGNYDRPEWQCETWRQLVGDRGFVLCPRGLRRRDSPSRSDPRFEYGSGAAFEQEINAALMALQSTYGAYVDLEAITLTGFSLGAILGAGLLRRHPERFANAVLIEGGFEGWTPATAAAFANRQAPRSHRVLFACGQSWCLDKTRDPTRHLERAGVATRVMYAKGEGHSYTGAVAARVAEALPWLFEGDARWRD